jgi:hypothetical protein
VSSTSSSAGARAGAAGLAVAGLLIALGGILHPRVDTSLEFEQGLVGMFESPAWTASHGLTMAGFGALAVSLAVLVRGWTPPLSVIGGIAAAAAGFAAVESLPHLLAASDADAIRRGDAAPLADLHTTLQAISTPAVGLSIVALAVAGARSGVLDGGGVATALAVIGGVAFAFAGPAIALTESSEFSPLFAGSAGIAVWAVLAGARTTRRLSRGTERVHDLAPAAGQVR